MRIERRPHRLGIMIAGLLAGSWLCAAPYAQDVSSEEFPVTAGGRTITARVMSPPAERLAADPALLLTFAMDRTTSLTTRPYSLTAEYFVAHGHRAVSFDLPNHGDRVDKYGDGIAGMRNAFVAGDDVFAAFVEDAKAVVVECIKRGLATPGHIAVAGTSRGGYMALRVLAADGRVVAGAGFAPVTDWRQLREFSADTARDDVRNLQLAGFIGGMLGKRVFIAIGNSDTRVGTDACKAFSDALKKADTGAGKSSDLVEFHLTDDKGHSCGDRWYGMGRALLLKSVAAK